MGPWCKMQYDRKPGPQTLWKQRSSFRFLSWKPQESSCWADYLTWASLAIKQVSKRDERWLDEKVNPHRFAWTNPQRVPSGCSGNKGCQLLMILPWGESDFWCLILWSRSSRKKKWGIYGGRWWKASEFTIRSKEDIPVLQRSSSRGKKNMQQTWVNLVYRATQEYHNQSTRPIGCQEYLIITVRRNCQDTT